MTSVILFLLVTGFAIALLAIPFLRRERALDRNAFDLTVYQDQLAELDRDLERGVIDEEASRAAKVEIERRILALAADDERQDATSPAASGGFGLISAVVLVVAVPVASALLYMELGKPAMRDVPLATRIIPEQQQQGPEATVLANIQQIQQRLETTPDDSDLWILLARTQLEASLFGDAAGSFNKAITLGEADPMVRSELGEAMVYAADGQVTPRAAEQFEAVLSVAPNEPRARYYISVSQAQEGNVDGAVEGLTDLLAVSPADAPWRPQIITAMRSMLESVGRSSDEVIANLPEGGAAIADHAGGAEDGQDEMIRGMVEGLAARLEEEPDDLQGWMMLGRSRLVLNEADLAREAFERARQLDPENTEVLLGYGASLLEPGETPADDPVVGGEALAVYEKLVTLSPDDPEPHWMLGLAAAQAGQKDDAVGHWQAMLELIDEGSEDKAIVEARIAALDGGDSADDLATALPSIAPGQPNGQPIADGERETAANDTTSPAPATPTPSAEAAPAQPSSGPGPEERAAMAALSPEERGEQIRSMVDSLAARLEDDPSDVDGWLRLAQSRLVLDEPDAAAEAYRRAMEVAPGNPDVLRAYASSLLGDRHPETDEATVSEEAAGLYRKIVELNPDDPEANWYLGLAALQDGTIDDAKNHWQLVLDVLGPDHPNYAMVQSSLKEVETQ